MRWFGRSNEKRGTSFDDARAALDRGDLEQAVDGFERYVSVDAANPNAWFNLGVAYKFRRDWTNAARSFRRAAQLAPTMEEASWNLGVAATALRDWPTARDAWRAIGVDPGPGDGPPSLKLGPSPVRLTGGEVVWTERVDPCRARIANVPLPESGHRWGDLVFHDVAPRGERQAWGKTWGVFDEIERMEEGEFPTLECEVHAPLAEDGAALDVLCTDLDLGAEDWTASVRWMCDSCSLGSPHAHAGDGGIAPIWLPARRYGFAGPAEQIQRCLTDWAAAGAGRSFEPLRPATTSAENTSSDA